MRKEEVKNEKNLTFRKKYVCMLSVFLFALFEPVLLCGCASAQDEVAMALNGEESDVPEPVGERTANQNMTEVSEPDGETDAAQAMEPQQVYIYVCGAVELPGVYSLRQGSRLYEAVELAGGLTGDADENCLNMARQITDGEQVVILTQEEAEALRAAGKYPVLENENQEVSEQHSGLVNINTATAAELTSVSGIGESRAQAIIEYRERNGGFGSIEDIKNVDGIKDGLFSKIKDKITI